jgi:cold shock CspA family protein/ribosome-associated translation inhibitor RaiA
MEIPVTISCHHIQLSPQEEALIQRKATKLERLFPRLTSCRIFIEGPEHHRNGGPYQVHLDLTIPGDELAVSRKTGHDFATALKEAFIAARSLLEHHSGHQEVARINGHLPALAPGRVVSLFPEQGYGFLSTEDGREIFFHRHTVADEGFSGLQVGLEVRFAEELGERGPQATLVSRAPTE